MKYILLMFVFIIPFSRTLGFDLWSNLTIYPHDFITLLMAIILLFRSFIKGSLLFNFRLTDKIIIIFLWWIFFSMLLSFYFFFPDNFLINDFIKSHINGIRALFTVTVPYFYVRSLQNKISAQEIYNSLIMSAILVSLITLIFFLKYGMLALLAMPRTVRPDFSLVCGFALIYVLLSLYFKRFKNSLKQLFYVVICVLLSLTIISHFEMKVIFGLPLSFIIWMIIRRKSIINKLIKKRLIKKVAVLPLIIVIIAILFSFSTQKEIQFIYQIGAQKGFKAVERYLDYVKNPFHRLIGEFEGNSIYGERYSRKYLWKTGWKVFLSNPLIGVGWGNYPYFSYKVEYGCLGIGLVSSHNIFLQIASQSGAIGIILFFVLLYVIYKNILEVCNIKSKNTIISDIILCTFLFSLIASFSCTLFIYENPGVLAISAFLWILWACIVNMVSQVRIYRNRKFIYENWFKYRYC